MKGSEKVNEKSTAAEKHYISLHKLGKAIKNQQKQKAFF